MMAVKIRQSSFVAYPHQKKALDSERKKSVSVNVLGYEFTVLPGVYSTSMDTVLMAKTAKVGKDESFLEVGTGCGAVSICVAKHAKSGVGVDINPIAVKTARLNAKRLGIKNVKFFRSDLFKNVKMRFDVILFNPPFSGYKARNLVDRMFWDPDNMSKRAFFEQASRHLKPGGRIYFGWANFKDIDVKLPVKLAKKHGFKITRISSMQSRSRTHLNYVLEMHLTG